jgi:hypothetical protein
MEEKIVATSGLIQGRVCQLIDRGRSPEGWQKIALIAPGARKPMRRYSMGWHVGEQRLSGGNWKRELRPLHPELITWLEMVCPLLWKAPGDSQ